ncbi:hypothetical protein I6N90_19275 [Paenibacillus sp. GSMTC-2017]|uniref:hypothetical protein n=1 Tax=Paenibacillus sp. GSMTC-2017 TaxID=2794350 RepID=UPI001A1B2121|nr:hypothetical protein [Paenibacillus sp. GSMTC-2017]MBH5319945.1 hypothetical protein [Paenibacillus sp. GSMTC-2017]
MLKQTSGKTTNWRMSSNERGAVPKVDYSTNGTAPALLIQADIISVITFNV